MNKVNYTFGVLSGGSPKIRYSNCLPSESQAELLAPLWAKVNDKDKLAEFLMRFLRCSENWPNYCSGNDSLNTYHIDIELADLSLKFSDLVEWADNCPYNTETYKVSKYQTAVDRVTNRLFGVLTAK